MPPIRPFAAAAALAVAVPSLALAQDAPPPPPAEPAREAPPARTVLEDTILVTASRREAQGFDLPWFADRVDHRDFVTVRPRRTLADALLDLPSVMVQRTSYGQASPFVRGFTGYHTVLLVDGIRLNNSTFRSGPNQYFSTIDPLSTDRVEVVRGPSSVLYGSDAVGGTVNAVTRRRTSFEPGFHSGARLYGRWASAERSWISRFEAEANQDDLGVLAGADYKSFDDVRVGDRGDRLDDTGYREQDGDVRLDWRESTCSTWTLAGQWVNQDAVPRTHRTVHSVSWHGTSVGDELRRDLTQERHLAYLRNRRTMDAPLADALEWTVSFHRQDEVQFRDRAGGPPARSDEQGYRVDTWGFQVQAEKETDAGLLTYGVEVWDDEVDSFRTNFEDGVRVLETVQGPVADDASYRLVGVYVQDEVELGGTTFTAGARWTHASADADRVDNPLVGGSDPATRNNILSLDDSWNTVVGSLRATRPVGDGWAAFGGVSQGFRAPNLSDLTRLDDTSGVETPSPGLEEERFVQAEVGLKTRGERWSGQVAFWRTWIRDLIVPSPTGALVGSTPEVRKDNVGDGWATGVDLEGAYRVDDAWTVSAAATWQDGEVDQLLPNGDEVRRPLSRLMPLTLVTTLTYREPGAPWRAWVSGRFADAQDELSLKDATDAERIPPGGTPGYGVVGIGFAWDVDERVTVSFAVENLFDKAHRIHGSGVNEPGRNAVLAVDVRF